MADPVVAAAPAEHSPAATPPAAATPPVTPSTAGEPAAGDPATPPAEAPKTELGKAEAPKPAEAVAFDAAKLTVPEGMKADDPLFKSFGETMADAKLDPQARGQ
jgi:hypothetical protein